MDADEELSEDWLSKVEAHVEEYPHEATTVVIHNIGNKETSRHRMVRLFPNDFRYRYKGRVHEQVYCNNEIASAVHSDLEIMHYGYVEDEYENKGKFDRYLALYIRSLEEDPNDGYMLYQLGKLYYSAGKYREAYEPLAKSADLQQFEMLYYAPMVVMLGYTLKEFGYSKEAFELLEPLLSLYPKFPDLPFALGMLAMEAGLFDRIEECFKLALSIGDTDKYTSILGVGTFRSSHNLAVFYEVCGKLELANQYYLKAASSGFEPSISRMSLK
ncbi:hypothetical protein PCCS19_13200 [Paenibacillus sp. CCS19]|nr:hypothetical protein PCCS19_13200 [Paenibacillus cellulosilyticus]